MDQTEFLSQAKEYVAVAKRVLHLRWRYLKIVLHDESCEFDDQSAPLGELHMDDRSIHLWPNRMAALAQSCPDCEKSFQIVSMQIVFHEVRHFWQELRQRTYMRTGKADPDFLSYFEWKENYRAPERDSDLEKYYINRFFINHKEDYPAIRDLAQRMATFYYEAAQKEKEKQGKLKKL